MSALLTLAIWIGAYLWLGWPGFAVAFAATFIEYTTGGRSA